ncbi:MAG: 50S ribosomal protein L23 [Elusimicrobia bacterium]|nr:50S ribosomal protein L23 [Elusimicrobiota bacterium]
MTADFDATTHILRPIMTERSTILKEQFNQYVFEVSPVSTKTDIKRAIEELFKVKVSAVRTMNLPGKFRRFGRGGGFKSDWKKAIVKLKAGDKIELVDQAA